MVSVHLRLYRFFFVGSPCSATRNLRFYLAKGHAGCAQARGGGVAYCTDGALTQLIPFKQLTSVNRGNRMIHKKMIGAAAMLLLVGICGQAQDRGERQIPAQSKSAPQKKTAKSTSTSSKQGPPQQRQAHPATAKQAPAQQRQAHPATVQQERAQRGQQQPARTQRSRAGSSAPQQRVAPAGRPAQAARAQGEQGAVARSRTQAAAPARVARSRSAGGQTAGVKFRQSSPPQRSAEEVSRRREQPELRLSERGSERIPEARYRSDFGSAHRFRIGEPRLVGGFSRFQYGGFWFGFAEPWPRSWYYSDPVYIVYTDDGYFLMNPFYPNARVSITVVM